MGPPHRVLAPPVATLGALIVVPRTTVDVFGAQLTRVLPMETDFDRAQRILGPHVALSVVGVPRVVRHALALRAEAGLRWRVVRSLGRPNVFPCVGVAIVSRPAGYGLNNWETDTNGCERTRTDLSVGVRSIPFVSVQTC